MNTSGTYTFNPSFADLTLEAFERINLQPNQLTPRHMYSARMSANLELQTWANRGVNLWTVDLQTQALSDTIASYNLDTATQSILDAYITELDSNGDAISDLAVSPLSRTEYANIARKDEGGRPTQYWFERITLPRVTFWQVPDADTTYIFKFYRLRRLQDVEFAGLQTVDLHYRFFDAFAAGLAARLAEKFAPMMLADKRSAAKDSWLEAAGGDHELVDLHVTPDVSGYFP